MSDTICLPKTHTLIILCVFGGLAVWYIHNETQKNIANKQYDSSNLELITKAIQELNKQNDEKNEQRDDNRDEKEINDVEYLLKRDQDILYDDFAGPERRVPSYIYPTQYIRKNINIPTRGYPDHYQIVGIAARENTETAYNIYGRQTFPGSSQYEYYVQSNMDGNIVKIPIETKGNREIEDGQNIMIPGTSHSKGHFIVKLYKMDVPRYNPYLY